MTVFPGTLQNFVKTTDLLSQETINQNQFPYHTFLIVDTRNWQIMRQHTLIINPQELSMQEPTRQTIINTIGGAYVDDFGRGLPTVTISGHTGWRLKPMPDGTGLQDGWQAFKSLRNNIFRYFTDSKDPIRSFLRNPYYQLRWYNWAHDEYYLIQPTEFDLQQSVSEPLLYQYTFSFTCVYDLQILLQQGQTLSIRKTDGSTWSQANGSAVTVNVSNLSALAAAMK